MSIFGHGQAPDTNRRSLLGWLTGGFLSLWAVGTAWVVGAFVRAPHAPEGLADREHRLGALDDLPVGKATLLQHDDGPIWVVRSAEDKLVGLSAVCTHMHCVLHWDEGQKLLRCPCHEASFDLNGNVLDGPAPRSLARHAVETKLGQIYVRTS